MIWGGGLGQKRGKKTQLLLDNLEEKNNSKTHQPVGQEKKLISKLAGGKKLNTNSLPEAPQIINGPSLSQTFITFLVRGELSCNNTADRVSVSGSRFVLHLHDLGGRLPETQEIVKTGVQCSNLKSFRPDTFFCEHCRKIPNSGI